MKNVQIINLIILFCSTVSLIYGQHVHQLAPKNNTKYLLKNMGEQEMKKTRKIH